MEHEQSPDGDRLERVGAGRRSRKSLIRLTHACGNGTSRPYRRRSLPPLTAAQKWQVRGRERPHPPVTCIAPGSIRGVAHALVSASGVAAAAKRFPYRIRVGFAQEVASPRSAESCPDPCPDRPADRHRSISVTRTQEAASSALQAPHSTGVCCCRNRPSRTRLWSDTHARQASALPRRPVRAANLPAYAASCWLLRDGRHHTDCRRAQFDTHLDLLYRTIMRAILGRQELRR